MDAVSLRRCVRCGLQWVDDRKFVNCPSCRRYSQAGGVTVVAGYVVEVKEVVLHGSDMGLIDPMVRRSLDILLLGERCPHGYLTWRMCDECVGPPSIRAGAMLMAERRGLDTATKEKIAKL